MLNSKKYNISLQKRKWKDSSITREDNRIVFQNRYETSYDLSESVYIYKWSARIQGALCSFEEEIQTKNCNI